MVMTMGKNLYQKVIEKHTVATLPSGNLQLFIGAHFCHEVTSPQAFSMIRERKLKVLYPERTFATADHIVPTDDNSRPYKDPVAEEMMQTIENNTRENKIRFFDIAKGEGASLTLQVQRVDGHHGRFTGIDGQLLELGEDAAHLHPAGASGLDHGGNIGQVAHGIVEVAGLGQDLFDC